MSSDFNKPAHPQSGWVETLNGREYIGHSPGLTIRQQAALMAMQGILAHYGYDRAEDTVAEAATDYADAVLRRELETRGRSDEK